MITNTKFYQKNKEDIVAAIKVGAVIGLVLGVVTGLALDFVGGIIVGLVGGIIASLVWGFVGGIIVGLVGGIIASLVSGLLIISINWQAAFPFLTQIWDILFVVSAIILLIEIFYWMDEGKGKPSTSFVLKKKFEATCEVLLGLSGIAQVYILVRKIFSIEYFPLILKWIGYFGVWLIVGIFFCLIGYIWLQLNKLKYKK